MVLTQASRVARMGVLQGLAARANVRPARTGRAGGGEGWARGPLRRCACALLHQQPSSLACNGCAPGKQHFGNSRQAVCLAPPYPQGDLALPSPSLQI